MPVIETGVGNCHLYVDAAADEQMALEILLNAKTQRPSVCNAVETLLVHADRAATFLPKALRALAAAGVTVHGDARVAAYGTVVPAEEADFADGVPVAGHRRLDRRLPGRRAASHPAVQHRAQRDDHHRLAASAAQRFCAEVDAAAVLVNASSRFVDGGEFGFGAEIGISTQKLHARGPMGLPEMTSTKYVVIGRPGAGMTGGSHRGRGRVPGRPLGCRHDFGLTLLEAEVHA